MSSTSAQNHFTWWLPGIVVLTLLVYWAGLHGPFLFDDDPNIVRNTVVHVTTLNGEQWSALAVSGHSGPLKRPVSMLSFGLNHYLHGLQPFWFKATNLLIHILTGLALVALVQLLLRTPALAHIDSTTAQWISLLVPAAWLLHPFNLTPVLYVVQRMSGLAVLFSVLGAIAYTRGRLRMLTDLPAWAGTILGTGAFLLLAIFSKETGVLLLVYLAVIETILLRFVTLNIRDRRILMGAWSAAILASLITIGAYFLQHPGWADAAYAFRAFDLSERLLSESRVVWWYLRMVLVPDLGQMGLHHDDFGLSRSLLVPYTTFVSVLGLVAVAVTAVLIRRRVAVLAFGVLWFLGGHLLESTVWPLELVAEHRNYLPSFGVLFALIALLLTTPRLRLNQRWRRTIVITGIALLATTTFVRAHSWRSMDDLFVHELANHPESPRNNYLAGWLNLRKGRQTTDPAQRQTLLTQAERYFTRSLELEPRMGQTAVGLTCLHAEFLPQRTGRSLDRLQQSLGAYPPSRGSIAALEWFTHCAANYPQHIPTQRYTEIMTTAERSARRSATRRVDVLLQMSRYFAVYKQDLSQAVAYTRQALRISPRNSRVFLALARWQIAARNLAGAQESLQRAQQYDGPGRYSRQIRYLQSVVQELERNPSARTKFN